MEHRQMEKVQSLNNDYLFRNTFDGQLESFNDTATTANDNQQNPISFPVQKKFDGWRVGASYAALLTTFSLLVNVSLAIWIGKRSSLRQGLWEVFEGDCEKVKTMNTWLHLAINALSTLVLGASNYCMQCLSSPTRPEVDRAHAVREILDIGVMSIRNIGNVARWKTCMWLILAFSSLPVHLLYNSAFYETRANNEYGIFLANRTIIEGGFGFLLEPKSTNYNYTVPPSHDLDVVIATNGTAKRFQRLETGECIREYAKAILTNRRTLLLVTQNATGPAIDGLYFLDKHIFSGNYTGHNFDWLCCTDPWAKSKIGIKDSQGFNEYHQNNNTVPRSSDSRYCELAETCENEISKVEAAAAQWSPYGYAVDYCLSEQVEEVCTLNANLSILFVVISCNSVKAVIMYVVILGLTDNPLITIGDAIESFLTTPDHSTINCCWMGKSDFFRMQRSMLDFLQKPKAARMNLKTHFWGNAASKARWGITLVIFTLVLTAGFWFLAESVHTANARDKDIIQLGFGELDTSALLYTRFAVLSPSRQILVSILIANTPHVILSFLYFNVNGTLTSMWLAAEWASFAPARKYLRVTNPKGHQKSTYFLHLPYKISILLLVVLAFFHWLLSQSIFLVVVSNYDSLGNLETITKIASCGYSPLAIILTSCLGFGILSSLVWLGSWRLPSGIPLAASCSAAISAACHPPSWDDQAYLHKIRYGAIPAYEVDGMIGHCSFTSGDVQEPTADKLYAGLRRLSRTSG